MRTLSLMALGLGLLLTQAACTCEALITPPDGGATGGGSAGGGAAGGGSAAGGGAGGGGAAGGGAAGGGAAGGGGAGGGGAGGGGAGGGGAGATQFTQYVRDLIGTDTTESALPRTATEFEALPDDQPITFPDSFFDGGL